MFVISKGKQHHQHKSRGQSLVEFAILMPILILLILGTMDFGRLFFTKIALTNAAREGANYLARNPSDQKNSFSETKNVIEDEPKNSSVITVLIDCSGTNCDVSCTPTDEKGCSQFGEATVTATTSVDLIFGNFLQTVGLTSGPITLSSTVKMMVQ